MNHERTRGKQLRRASAWAAAGLVLTMSSERARAEDLPVRQTPIGAPGRSIASNDQSSAIVTNPANLGFLPTSEMRWTWVRTAEDSRVPGRGHAFDLAFALPAHIGAGMRLDYVRPGGPWPDYAWMTWALGMAPTQGWSFGMSIQHAYSDSVAFGGNTTLSLATSVRPSPFLALSIVGRDLTEPSDSFRNIDRSVDLAVAVRPTGKRNIEIGLEDHYLDRSGRWLPRATVGVDVPYVGRLRGEVGTSDITRSGTVSYVATAGVEVGVGTATVEGGGIFGTGLGSGNEGFYMGAALTGQRSPGIPEPAYALKIRIDDTPGARSHVHLLRRLWRLAADRDLKAVAFVLKAEPASSLAHAEELADAIRLLRANGKKVICHLEDAQGRSLYLCSQADRVVINPAGVVRFAGLRTQYQYYGALLGKLGVKAQFVRIGDHKSAPEAYMRDGASDVARADHLDMLHEYEDVFLSDIGGGRRISKDTLADTFAHGPFVAKEAIQSRLIDGTAFDDEIDKVVTEVVGRHVHLRDESRPPAAPVRFGSQRSIAVVYVEGDMIDGKSRDIPLIGTRLVGSYTVAKALKDAREDPRTGAVVLRVETPGGSSLAADVIWREIVLTAKVKPVVVSMGSYAASGGYYIASAGNVIYANPLTVTGSIGIFYGKADVSELFSKIGVTTETYKTSPRADGESMYRPYTDDELRELQKKVGQLYEIFLDRVAAGRNLSRDAVDAVGQGRVWTGRQAFDRKLVDHIGGMREALDEARRLARLPSDAPINDLPVVETSLLGTALKLAGVSESSLAPQVLLPAQLLDVARAMAPFTVFAADEPLTRMEVIPLEAP